MAGLIGGLVGLSLTIMLAWVVWEQYKEQERRWKR